MRSARPLSALLSVLGLLLLCTPGAAQEAALPRSLVAEALADDLPRAFAPTDFSSADFRVDRLAGDASLHAELEPGSLRWTRVAGYVVVPRAVLIVRAADADGGVVEYAGFTQPLAPARDRSASAAIAVVLISGAAYPIEVEVRSGGQQRSARFAIRFAPRAGHDRRVLFDSSCSPHGVRVASGSLPRESWLYVGCRMLRTPRSDGESATLELYALWDQADAPVEIDGVARAPTVDSLFGLHVAAQPGHVRLATRGSALVLAYTAAERVRNGFLGLGLGPYYYAFRDAPVSIEAPVPLVTLYAGYNYDATTRFVYFNATVLHRYGSIDQGLYLWLEQFRLLDERVSLNILLGANVLIYRHGGRVTGRLSVPQGIELIGRDVFARSWNLTAGAFLYPEIADRAYYNLWLRFGPPTLFGELNYIEWKEPHGERSTHSRALGLSFGAALLRFL